MSDLITFDFGGQKVRTAGTHERPLFCAADACAVVELPNVGQALSRLPAKDVEYITTSDVQGKTRPIAFLTESGLYKLVLRSRKPQAETFTDWVTGEVLPAIRRKGYYSAIEAEHERQTELLLERCFPKLPSRSVPIFRPLIAALVRLRRRGEPENPIWARMLAQWVYGWAIRLEGQQEKRRSLNPNPGWSRTDHSMFSDVAMESVKHVVHVGVALASNGVSATWEDWKLRMELHFGDKAVQLPMMVQLRALPGGRA